MKSIKSYKQKRGVEKNKNKILQTEEDSLVKEGRKTQKKYNKNVFKRKSSRK